MKKLLLFALMWLCVPLVGQTSERILAYDIDIYVQASGDIDIEERITVRAEGHQIRRGIYRDFPTHYQDKLGNKVVVGFEVIDVRRDNQPEPWFIESLNNGVRVNTGSDSFLPVPNKFTYTLRYRTNRQIGFFDQHDELYWNAIGTGWVFAIQSATVTVHLPQSVSPDDMHVEGYTGEQGSKEQNYSASILAPGIAQWQLTKPLLPSQGLTLVLTFPKGIVTPPSQQQELIWLLKDNQGLIVALGALVINFLFMLFSWLAVGRDPKSGVIIPRYEPVAGLSPGAMRFIKKMGPDARGLTADLISLAVVGLVQIEQRSKNEWSLHRVALAKAFTLSASQTALMKHLFAQGDSFVINPASRSSLVVASYHHYQALKKEFQGTAFSANSGLVALSWLLTIGGVAAIFTLANGMAAIWIVAAIIILFVMNALYARLIAAPTTEGRKLLDEIEGFKLYLSVAEQQDLARLSAPGIAPQLDAKRFEQLLPYAIALDVEDAWSKKFIKAVGSAAAAQAAEKGMTWYRGAAIRDITQLSSTLGSSLSNQIASSSRAPGSSSGSGGGGSSGGGGGGGGGGGR